MTTAMPVRRAAKLIGVHENTIRNWADRGILRSVHLPGSNYRRIPEEEVERLRRDMWGDLGFDDGRTATAHITGTIGDDEFGDVDF